MNKPKDEPFNGLTINGYGIYNKNDQKRLNEYITSELNKLFDLIESEVIGEDAEKKVEDWDCPCGTDHHLETDYHQQNELRQQQRTQLQLIKERMK